METDQSAETLQSGDSIYTGAYGWLLVIEVSDHEMRVKDERGDDLIFRIKRKGEAI